MHPAVLPNTSTPLINLSNDWKLVALPWLPSTRPSCGTWEFSEKYCIEKNGPIAIWPRSQWDRSSCDWGLESECCPSSKQLHALRKRIQRCKHQKGNGQIPWCSCFQGKWKEINVILTLIRIPNRYISSPYPECQKTLLTTCSFFSSNRTWTQRDEGLSW